ncbi:hypothetical protein CL622_04870 [archaeon]|nr:hypothetical protein [archaeon]|tara:strand:- start:1130 stop:1360 length:231 start_codon:yes stop_codon:yes gene_type:complete
MEKLYFQGIISVDPRPWLIKSYKLHLLVDYGRKEFKGETIRLNKENINELLGTLKKLLDEIEAIIFETKKPSKSRP